MVLCVNQIANASKDTDLFKHPLVHYTAEPFVVVVGRVLGKRPSVAVSIRMPAASHTKDSTSPFKVALKGGSCISNLENSTTLQFHGSYSPMRHVDDPALRNHALMQLQLLEKWRFI